MLLVILLDGCCNIRQDELAGILCACRNLPCIDKLSCGLEKAYLYSCSTYIYSVCILFHFFVLQIVKLCLYFIA